MRVANFLTGPVAVRAETRQAFEAPPLSHRDPEFRFMMTRTCNALTSLTQAARVALMVGSGTLANDCVAAQLANLPGPGLILSNGEFGERLIDHAKRWRLKFSDHRRPWGEAFDWSLLATLVERMRPSWIWAVVTETSTGVSNPLDELRALSARAQADLCVDAISAIGTIPVDLRQVRFATAVSSKGLAAYPGLAAVFHDGRLVESSRVPRYLDLAGYADVDAVPFTHSSNLVAALECSLAVTPWLQKFEYVRRSSMAIRAELRQRSLAPLASDDISAAGVITIPMSEISSAEAARSLAQRGFEVAHQSRYLRERNWLQIALMGEIDRDAVRRLPAALEAARSPVNASRMRPDRCRTPARIAHPD